MQHTDRVRAEMCTWQLQATALSMRSGVCYWEWTLPRRTGLALAVLIFRMASASADAALVSALCGVFGVNTLLRAFIPNVFWDTTVVVGGGCFFLSLLLDDGGVTDAEWKRALQYCSFKWVL